MTGRQANAWPARSVLIFTPTVWCIPDQLQRARVKENTGRCTSLSWGGEGAWQHGPGKPGGRRFCYFDGNNAVIVWTHERRGQSTHRDVLGIAREGGLDHVRLIGWWAFAHHLIGKVT